MRRIILLTALLLVASCATNQNPQKPNPTDVVTEKPTSPVTKLEKGWRSEYSRLIQSEVVKLPNHMKYNSSTKYWSDRFYKALAAAESGFNPYATYHETTLGDSGIDPWAKKKGFKDVTYWSMGFFQLSYSDSDWYKCPFDWKKDRLNDMKDISNTIYVPENQIRCAMMIMERMLKRTGTPFFDSRNYWIVLKPGAKYKKYHKNFLYYYNKWK